VTVFTVKIYKGIDENFFKEIVMTTQADQKHKAQHQNMSMKESVSKLKQKFTHSIRAIDDSAKNKPWKFIAGCAAGGAAIGYLFGLKRKKIKNSSPV
jgi:ElaB/YqjD/DUF883 family membrane-anchored ribosome-binding protein